MAMKWDLVREISGQVTKISKNGEVIAKIGSDYNENKGLDGPTVSHFAKDGFYMCLNGELIEF